MLPLNFVSESCRARSDLINPEDVREPEYFISHAWQGRFVSLVDGVLRVLRNASDDTAVWLDFVAVNQHNDTRPAMNQVSFSCGCASAVLMLLMC